MKNDIQNTNFFNQVAELLQVARKSVVSVVNTTMVYTYFEIGRKIVEEEQGGEARAVYGDKLLEELSKFLTERFGKGFSVTNLRLMRQLFNTYSIHQTVSDEFVKRKTQTLSAKFENQLAQIFPSHILNTNLPTENTKKEFKLSWSHYQKLMRIDNVEERDFYEIEAIKNNWSLRELQRQYDSALYTRLALSRDKEEIKRLSQEGQIIEQPKDIIKDPYILEFVGLPQDKSYSEGDLESALIDKLEDFLLELGSGFTFAGRQKRITFDEKHFFIDLVFYNRVLKCFVLIDLKIGELKHQDLGQMQMYVNYYDREMRLEDENKTIGIVLCQDKTQSLVEYTLPEDNKHIFASKYKTILPSEEEFKKILRS